MGIKPLPPLSRKAGLNEQIEENERNLFSTLYLFKFRGIAGDIASNTTP